MKTCKEKLPEVLSTLIEQINEGVYDDDCLEALEEIFDESLDFLLNEDFFGTEGQLDPRGDHRE